LLVATTAIIVVHRLKVIVLLHILAILEAVVGFDLVHLDLVTPGTFVATAAAVALIAYVAFDGA
jgi:hypothetical protein